MRFGTLSNTATPPDRVNLNVAPGAGQHKTLTKTPPSSCFDCASEPRQNIGDKRAAFDFQYRRVGHNRRCASLSRSIYGSSALVAGHEQGRVNSNQGLEKNTVFWPQHPCQSHESSQGSPKKDQQRLWGPGRFPRTRHRPRLADGRCSGRANARR